MLRALVYPEKVAKLAKKPAEMAGLLKTLPLECDI
jgi:hypothetical protein